MTSALEALPSAPLEKKANEVNDELSRDQAIQLARQEAILNGLTDGEIAFAAYNTNSATWWIGVTPPGKDGFKLATVCLSKDGKQTKYLPIHHKIVELEAVEIGKRAFMSEMGNIEFEVLYSRKAGDIWLIGVKSWPKAYGGGAEYQIRIGPTGGLLYIKPISSGFRM